MKLVENEPGNPLLNRKGEPFSLDHPVGLYIMYMTLRHNHPDLFSDYDSEFLDKIFIRYIPVCPPSLRPANLVGSTVTISDVSVFYEHIMNEIVNFGKYPVTLDAI